MGEVSSGFGSRTKGDMSIKPKVAIITVYYNRRDHVIESVQSLLNQTYDNLEVVIVDDCSTDDTYALLQETVADSTRVNLKQNEYNKGFTQTLIDTIIDIDAEYIAIHGAGDISLPTRVEEQVNYLDKNLYVGVVTTDITNLKKPKFHKTEITLQDLLKKNRITHGAVMFRKKVYDQVGGYRSFFTTRQDKDLWFRMSLVTKIHFLNKKLYNLVEIESSVSKSAAASGLPTLISAFAVELVKERIVNNIDSLDKFGDKSALFFNPKVAKPLLRRNFIQNLLRGNKQQTNHWLGLLIKVNQNSLGNSFYKIINFILNGKKNF